jgi:phosphoglycerate dehydrogenase-like enzyme
VVVATRERTAFAAGLLERLDRLELLVTTGAANASIDVAAAARALAVEPTDKDDLLTRSDVVSLHLRLSDRTRGVVGAREPGLMRPTSYLVNTSRGPLVDEPAPVGTEHRAHPAPRLRHRRVLRGVLRRRRRGRSRSADRRAGAGHRALKGTPRGVALRPRTA